LAVEGGGFFLPAMDVPRHIMPIRMQRGSLLPRLSPSVIRAVVGFLATSTVTNGGLPVKYPIIAYGTSRVVKAAPPAEADLGG